MVTTTRIAAVALLLLGACSPSMAAELEEELPRDAVVSAEPMTVVSAELETVPEERAAAESNEAEWPVSPLRVAVISDLNSRYGSKSYSPSVHAAARVLVDRIQPDLVLITGDMVAGQKKGLDYRGMWKSFHASVTDPLIEADIPVAPTPGNHDGAPGFELERKQYVSQWTDRKHAARVQYIDDSHYPLYYSFVQGGVFFAAVDATAVGPLRGHQREWLDEQLARSEAEVEIVFGHLPNHPFAKHKEREILDDADFEEILERHSVDAYVSGHHHAYYPGAVGRVRHVAVPCLGAGPRVLLGDAERSDPALLLLEIDAGGIRSLEAFSAPDFDHRVERRSLPEHIHHGEHDVVRDDLADLGEP